MIVNEPSPLAFADKLPLPKAEDCMTAEQKYWYNKGHEDGRALTTYNKPRVEALEAEIEKWKYISQRLESVIKNNKAEIDALKSEIESLKSGGEPVAWTNADCLEMVKEDGESNMWWMPDLAEDIPLYLHPAKALTDDERLVLMMELLNWNRSLDEPLIKIAHEGGVALKVLELLRKAKRNER